MKNFNLFINKLGLLCKENNRNLFFRIKFVSFKKSKAEQKIFYSKHSQNH